MAYQLNDIISKVQRRVRDTGYSSSEITDYINDTQNAVFNDYHLKFMRTTATYTVTSGNSDITAGAGLPTNHVQTIKLIDTTSGQEREIENIDHESLDMMYPDNTDVTVYANGQPLFWYDDGDTIRLFPAPAGAYTLSLRYYKRPAVLSSPTDVPDIPAEFEELLVLGAAYRVLQVKDNYDQAGILENKYFEQLQLLVARYSQSQAHKVHRMRINRVAGHYTSLDSFRRIP